MAENIANDVQGLLNAAIADGTTTAITTTGATGFPAANFRIRIDNELMLVTSTGTGTNWTVTRGVESSTGVAHANGTPIIHVLTAGGIKQWLADGFAPITNSLAADVSCNVAANFFDAASVSQGSVGTWFVSGHVLIFNTAVSLGAAKLWDGTTVISSAGLYVVGGQQQIVHLSGFISAPAGNLRISVNQSSNTSGVLRANNSGSGKDSTITAIRIA